MSGRPRFLRWYRVLPLCAMAIVAVLSLGLASSPATLVRRWAYPVSYQDAIVDSSSRHDVDPLLVCAVIRCESGWNPEAVSDAGAVGLMQLMPSTSEELADYGIVNRAVFAPEALTDPATNIEYGCAYLGQLQRRLSSIDEVIAAYNAGPGSVEQWLSGGGDINDVIDFPETALYLTRVKQSYGQYQQLYTGTLSER